MHSSHALDGPQKVNAAGEAPPSVAGLFHETPLPEPTLLMDWGGIAAKIATVNFEIE